MSLERAQNHFKQYGLEDRILTFPVSSATVELAAAALHCEPGRIAKTLAFMQGEQVLLVVAAGDARSTTPDSRPASASRPRWSGPRRPRPASATRWAASAPSG